MDFPKEGSDCMNTTEQNTFVVAGFEFESERDARDAEREQQNIMTLKSKIDFNNTEDLVKLYQRLVERKLFRTPVGYQFLSEFREYLVGEGGQPEESIYAVYVEQKKTISRAQQEQLKYLQDANQKLEHQKKYYLISIAALIALVLLMFVITALNPNVGYINTENKILNQYSEWEERLTEREKELNEREAQMNSEPSTEDEE
jgi:hypothetical protein